MKDETDSSDFLKINEAARYLGVTRRWLYRRIWSGDLSASKIGGLYFIRKQDLETLIDQGKTDASTRNDNEATSPPRLKCGYCFRLLESDLEIGDVCESGDCEQLICVQCRSENNHFCVNHIESRDEQWSRALQEFRAGQWPLLVRSNQARLREINFIQRLQISLASINTVKHPLSNEILTVKQWDDFMQEGDERAGLMKLMNKAVLENEWLSQYPLNAFIRYHIPGGLEKTKKNRPLVIQAQVLSRSARMLQKGFDTQPLGLDELSPYLQQIGNRAQKDQEFTLAVLASCTGWDEPARRLIQGQDGIGSAFSHRWMLVYLTDLETRELLYNRDDSRARDYVDLFNPLLSGEIIMEVAEAVEREMGVYSSLTLQLAMEIMPYSQKSIEKAFEHLAISGRYVLTEVEGLGQAIVRS